MKDALNVTAIVTKAEDRAESDRLIRLFTMEGGMINAKVRGVKKPKAKLKFAAQPFALCKYTLSERGGYYSVTGAVEIESLFAITYDTNRYGVGCLMLEVADTVVDEIPNPELFVKLLKALKALIYDETEPYLIGAKFTIAALAAVGYGNTYEKGGNITNRLLYDIAYSTLEGLKNIDTNSVIARAALESVAHDCEYRFDVRLKSLSGI